MRRIQYRSGNVASELRDSLRDDVAAYVEDVGDEAQLLALAEQLGAVIEPGVGMPSGAHDGRVYSVQVRNNGRGVDDKHGNVILSSTNQVFPAHTDGYNRAEPPRLVFLLRHDCGDEEVPTVVHDAREVLRDLPPDVAAALQEPIFPSALGPVALLRMGVGEPDLRFNAEEIARWDGQDPNQPMDDRARSAVTSVSDALRQHEEAVVIAPGDCLVIHNRRACHGRAALSGDSTRVLKRVWVA